MPCPTHNPKYDIKSIFARRLRVWRKSRRLPLKKVARELGLSISGLSQWERGLVFPTADNISLIACYTKLPPCHFFCPEYCEQTEGKLKRN